jgi:hypothetical protein
MNVIKLYFFYAREDNPLRDQLLRHLSWLIQSGQVIPWDESMILAGLNLKQEVVIFPFSHQRCCVKNKVAYKINRPYFRCHPDCWMASTPINPVCSRDIHKTISKRSSDYTLLNSGVGRRTHGMHSQT